MRPRKSGEEAEKTFLSADLIKPDLHFGEK